MIELPLFAADFESIISIIVFLLFVIMSIVGKVLNTAGEKQKGQPQRRPAPRPAGQGQDEPVAAEIRQFLERVGRGGKPSPKADPTLPHERPVAVEVIEPRGLLSSADRLQPHHGSEALQDHLEPHLAQEVALADDQMEARVHGVFDHKLGSLATERDSAIRPKAESARKATAAVPTTAAAGLAAMLADPISLQQAVLLSEILERPEHRWS